MKLDRRIMIHKMEMKALVTTKLAVDVWKQSRLYRPDVTPCAEEVVRVSALYEWGPEASVEFGNGWVTIRTGMFARTLGVDE